MKKLFIISIVSLHLLAVTSLQELMKLPVLFQHYFEHKDLNNEITFMNYLVDHYNQVPHTDNDQERDNQLPFKSSNQYSSSTNAQLGIPPYHQVNIRLIMRPIVKLSIGYQEHFIPSSYQSKIWQPPKV